MTYEEFNQQFKNQANRITYDKKMELAIAICKKLFFDYQEFCVKYNWGDTDYMLDTIEFIDKSKNANTDNVLIAEKIKQIEKITPDTEDFSDASYALNCCVAVSETLDFMIDHKSDRIYAIGTCLTDTIDFKIQEKSKLKPNEIDQNLEMIEARMYLLEMTR